MALPETENNPPQQQVIYDTHSEKLSFFRQRIKENRMDWHYMSGIKDLLREISGEIASSGIDGESGRHYNLGDVVDRGELILMCERMEAERKKDLAESGLVPVFSLNPDSYYLKDGVTVEMLPPPEA